MQIKAMQSRHFVIHLDISTIEKLCVRATFSNMVKEPKVTSRTIQYPCHPSPGVWTMLCINTPTLLGQYTRLVPKGMVLKSMQICANIKLRGIYTSDILYPQNMLPRGMRLSPKTTVEDCQWIYAPLGSRPDDVLPITGDESDDDEFFSCGKGDSCSKAEIRTTAAATDPNEGEEPGLRNSRNGTGIGGTGDQIAVEGMQADCSWISKSSNRGGGTAVTQGEPLLPSSLFSRGALLQAIRMMGTPTGACNRKRHAMWAGREKALIAQASTLVYLNLQSGSQKCLFGHSAAIDLLDVSPNLAMAATVQNDKGTGAAPQIRIWHVAGESPFCAAILQCPSLVAIRVFRFDSQCRCMVVAGIDTQRRQQLQIWDLSRLRSEGRCSLVARQVSDFDVACIKFSPFDEFCLISCGNENIRFWRIKNSHLPGCSVVLEAAARANCYTDLDFECSRTFQSVLSHAGEKWLAAARVFCSSTSGCVAQVDYVSRQLQRVYKLHAGPIWSLSVSDAFCATASEDGFIRVWPLTFQSCFMHVKSQEAAAVGVDGSEDGLQLLCTAADGSVGVLNLGSQQYQPLLRTHARPIRDAAVSEAWRELYTVSTDRSVRVWSLPDLHEAFEFQSSADLPTRVACHPLERVLAVGFDSGALRVFDIDAKPPQVMLEARHHLHSICGIYFVRNAARDHRESHVEQSRCLLVAVDSCGAISIHDEQLEYQLTQRIENPGVHLPPGDMPPLAFSPGGEIMARYFDGRCICCFAFPSLLYKAKVCLPRPARRASASTLSALPYTASAKQGSTEGGAQITAYGFVGSDQGVLVVCSSDSKMRFYDLREASGPDPCPDSPFDEEGHSFTPPYWSPRSVTAGATQRSRSCTRGGCTPKTISLSGRPSTGCSDASKRCSSLSQRPVLPAASCFGVLSRCLTCIREIPLMSGAITAAIVTHFELDSQRGLMREEDNVTARAKDAFPQIALTAGTDNIVKLWNMDASPCLDSPRQRKGQLSFGWSACRSSRPSSGVVPGVSPSSPSRARSVFPSPVVNDLPPFQSFSGHLGTPFRLFVCGDLVVSVSSADVVLWAFQHRELEALAAQCVPLQFPQFRPPLCVHVDAARTKKNGERYESPHSLSLGKDLSGQFPVCRPTPVSGRSVVVLPSGPRHATRGGDTPDSSGMNGTEQAPGNPLRRMEASVAQAALCCSSQSSSSHPLACRSLSADSKTNTHSDLRGAPASESTSTNGGRPAASTDSDGRCQTEEVRCVETDCTYVEVIEPGDTSRLLQLRHIVGATVATSRGGCIWRPLQGLLCHAVGDWVLVERLDVRSRCDSEGKCLGLLPAQSSAAASLEGGPSRCIWRRSSDPLFRDLSRGSACPASSCEKQNGTRIFPFNRKSSAPGPGGFHSRSLGREAPKSCHARCVSPQPSTSRTGIRKRKEDKDFFGLACEKHRAARDHFSVCRDSRLGLVLTMAVNQKGTVLATIHTSRVQLEEVKGKFSGEEEERGFDKILAVWRLDDCMIARLVVLPRAWYSESPSGQEPTEAGKPVSPALAFCGTEYLVVASASSRPHLDVYLLSDFLKVTPDLASLPIPPLQPAPVVGTAVDTPVVRLLTCAKTDDVEIVYISPRSTIFWKVDHVHSLHEDVELEQCHFVERSGGVRCGCDVRSTSRCLECDDHGLDIDHGLSLHFQFADLPWRMRDDPDLCHTTGCLTRRCPSSPTLLLLATNAGFVYGVNFDTNTLVFELQVATAEPVTFIACDRAQDLFCGLGSTLKRWSVDLVSLLPIPGTGEEEALQHSPPRLALVDLRGSTVSTEFQLDGVVKTMQSDAQAAEAVVSTSANTIWYLQWNQKARVRLQSGHTGPIRFVCSAYGLTVPCSRRFPRHHFSAEGKEQSRGSGGTVPSQLCRLDSSLPSCSEIFATAGDDLTIRLWSCWPRPQQVAIFSLKQRCCGLAFIQPDVLTAIFDNGCLRLIDIRCFRIVGRLQATPEGDAPTSLACVTENHALVATRSGVVLSIQLVTENPSGVSPKRLPHSGPETHQKTIKHASISRITALLFGNVGSTLQSTCSQEGDTSGESPWAPPPITHMAVSREFSKLSKDEASVPCSERELLFARVAVTTRGGLCAIGTYAPNRSSKHLTWLTDQSFVVKVSPRADQGHCYTAERADWSQAAFVGEDALVIVRASTVFLVRIAAKEVVKKVRVLDRVPDGCLNERQWMVASLAYLAQKKALVLILKGGSFLVLDVPSLFASSGPCRNIHPCLDQVVATVPSTELPSFVSVALIGPTHVLVGVKEVVTSVRIV